MAFRDWNPFPTAKPPAPDSSALARSLADLDRLIRERPELATAGHALREILRAAFRSPIPEVFFEVDRELMLSSSQMGVPAFHIGERSPQLNCEDILARGLAVLEVIRDDHPSAKLLSKAIRDGSIDLTSWANEVLGSPSSKIDEFAIAQCIDPALARSVLRLSLLPGLEGLSQKIAAIRSEVSWTRSGCPNCGSPATLAESRGLEQRRHWRCGLCAADWQGDRLKCPFCDEIDHRKLSYLAVDGEQDRYRISRCETCGGTLKVIATLELISAPGLLVAELAMTHLDHVDAR